jgi:23S rRNA G2445 N2-methylase RlmL
MEQIASVRDLSAADAYHTFHLSAAGSDSSIMMRLKSELASKTGLHEGDEEGDLLIRVRRAVAGWESLVRLSLRPLATRSWRVCNREGALNAAVAHAMILLTRPQPEDVFLNMLCGSGTLLIERLTHGPVKSAVGYDEDPMALRCAEQNVTAAGYSEQIRLRQGDARDMTLPAKSVDVIVADMPFGHLVGTHESNLTLYPELLNEAARVAKPGARCVIISHEIRLMETLLDESQHWKTQQVIRIMLGGLHPRIFVLRRK